MAYRAVVLGERTPFDPFYSPDTPEGFLEAVKTIADYQWDQRFLEEYMRAPQAPLADATLQDMDAMSNTASADVYLQRYWFMLLMTWYSEKKRYGVKRWPKGWSFEEAKRMSAPTTGTRHTHLDWIVRGMRELQRVEEWVAAWNDCTLVHLYMPLKARHQGLKVHKYWAELERATPPDVRPFLSKVKEFDDMVARVADFLLLGSRHAPEGFSWRYGRALHAMCQSPFLVTSVPLHHHAHFFPRATMQHHCVLAWFLTHPRHVSVGDVRFVPLVDEDDNPLNLEAKRLEHKRHIDSKALARALASEVAWTAFRAADAARFTPVLFTVAQIRENARAKRYDDIDYARRYTAYAAA